MQKDKQQVEATDIEAEIHITKLNIFVFRHVRGLQKHSAVKLRPLNFQWVTQVSKLGPFDLIYRLKCFYLLRISNVYLYADDTFLYDTGSILNWGFRLQSVFDNK